MRKILLTAMVMLLLYAPGLAGNDESARLLRYPDINQGLVAFVYAGDIWTVPADGGQATRLTSHKGLEVFPKISPNGQWIAFSGEYSGTRQVFVMPSHGGTPRQLTFYNDAGVEGMPLRGGFDHIPLDWTNDSKKILIRANRTPYGERNGKYFLVSLDGGLETPLPIPEGGFGTFSPDQDKIVYTPITREFRTWKRYKGGRAQDVWIYDLKNNTSERITDFAGTDHHPSWYKSKIYFLSDRDIPGLPIKLNFWSYDLDTKTFAPVTKHSEFDNLWPSGEGGLVVYENGGYIYKLDLNTGVTGKIDIHVSFDNPNVLPYFKNVAQDISRFGAKISPTGKRGLFDARGDLFTVPAKDGLTYNLTRTQEIREMYPAWSPDGKWIAYMSDATGNYEIYLLDPNGKEKDVRLTDGHKVWKTPVTWSPDSTKLLFYDADRKLQILDIKSKKITVVDSGFRSDVDDYNWSHDSQWVTYTKEEANHLESIYVYSLAEKKSYRLLDTTYDNFSPIFSQDGKYLYFVSNRDFNMDFRSGFSAMEFDFVIPESSRIYALALVKDAAKLFEDKNDVEEVKANQAAADAGSKDKDRGKTDKKGKADDKQKAGTVVAIDFDGLSERITVLPLETGRYGLITDLGENKLLYNKRDEIYIFDIKEKKSELVIKGIRGGDLSADGKKMLYRSGDKYGIIDIKPNQKAGDGTLNMQNVTMRIDPKKEWQQMFDETWLIFRDWFYVKNMHGVDWQEVKERYAKLLPYVGHRFDLDHIFGEMVSELNCGHAYVGWGDFEKVTRIDTGLLGAELEADAQAGRYKISKIYQGENWNEYTRSPLTDPGINVKEGDYLVSIDGNEVTIKDNPYYFLENTSGRKIEIKVNAVPKTDGARAYLVKPIVSEYDLRTMDWVNSRRAMVDKLSGGRIGYIFVPDTAAIGNREMLKGFYAYNDKDAFIIDDRYNEGGWSPGKMIDRIAGEPISFWSRRGLQLRPEPIYVLDGPKVMLINHYSSSGGDNFPFWFKQRNLGKLIGTRTWGGLVGYGWSPELLDGASYAVPSSGIVSNEGEYIVEGVGIYPDPGFEVYDRPEQIAAGKDPSIEMAVEYLMKELQALDKQKKMKIKDVPPPPDPDRSKWFEKEIH